jgi:hypothetical protein
LKVYKIQNTVTKLYSSKGVYGWDPTGNIWTTIGKAKQHITLGKVNGQFKGVDLKDIVLLEYDLTLAATYDIEDYNKNSVLKITI